MSQPDYIGYDYDYDLGLFWWKIWNVNSIGNIKQGWVPCCGGLDQIYCHT